MGCGLVGVVELLLADGDDVLRLRVLGVGHETGQEVAGDVVVQFPLLAAQVVAVGHLQNQDREQGLGRELGPG